MSLASLAPSPLQASNKSRLITGKVWADGRCGWAPVRESRESGVDDIARAVTAAQQPFRVGGMECSIAHPTYKWVKEFLPPLGLSSVPNSHRESKPRARRGSKGLTSHGKKIVFNAIDYMQWRFGKKHLTFCTVTLPAVSDEQGAEIVEKWSQIIKIFVQNIGRKLHGHGLPRWIVGASEIQELRSRSSAFAPLHFHCVYVGRLPGKGWAIGHRQVRESWRSALVSAVPSLGDLDYSACENVQAVKQSAANYLSKYVTKGRCNLGDVSNSPSYRNPTAWYSCTRNLSRAIRGVVRSGVEVGTRLAELEQACFIFRRRIDVAASDGTRVTVGWAGLLKREYLGLIRVSKYVPIPEFLALDSGFCVPRVRHEGYSYLFSDYSRVHAPIHVPIPLPVVDSV